MGKCTAALSGETLSRPISNQGRCVQGATLKESLMKPNLGCKSSVIAEGSRKWLLAGVQGWGRR